MYPVLYPETAFTDTGILETYRDESGDTTVRTVSIRHSWTLKVCSGVRVYGESNHLAFFLYEKQLAMKYFAAHSRAQPAEAQRTVCATRHGTMSACDAGIDYTDSTL